MFRVKRSITTTSSQLFDESTFYRQFSKDLKSAKDLVVIESPFLTEKRVLSLKKELKFLSRKGVEARVFTREPAHHPPQLEDQAYKAIKLLRKWNVRVFACSDMRHRKLAIIDGHVLWDGSLNPLSQSNSVELMRRTDSTSEATRVAKFVGIKV